MTLSPSDFPAFFEEVHGQAPFPWQTRLLEEVAGSGAWPDVLDLPTGSGKTAAIDIALFHLALEADRGPDRRAPVRIAFVVDRRLVVDDAYLRAEKLAHALADAAPGTIRAVVAARLARLGSPDRPLIARRLRGGIPRENDWARTPSQPTVLCSTVDQIGSRLLFRGYGVSDSMKPVHAGLIGADCLILLDEAHLAEPFRQTLELIHIYKGRNWRETEEAAPWSVSLLTATPGARAVRGFVLHDEDRNHPILRKRLEASKPARLIEVATKRMAQTGTTAGDEEEEVGPEADTDRIAALVTEVKRALAHCREHGLPTPALGVVVNRVARARAVFDVLLADFDDAIGTGEMTVPVLMIGPARPADRDAIAAELEPIRTGNRGTLDKPLIIVATQCIEAGVDIDLDALVTEAAPMDSLRQRFGRLDRAGRGIAPYAAIVITKRELASRYDDPVYGKAIKAAWDYLRGDSSTPDPVDFGVMAFEARTRALPIPDSALSPKADAPILLPAHLDLLSHTAPVPAADPEVALYLHGPERQPDSISIIWRADLDPGVHRDVEVARRLLKLVPPRAAEAIQLPVWAVRRWLAGRHRDLDDLADAAGAEPSQDNAAGAGREAFRWAGDDDRSQWVRGSQLRPGDTIVVPADYGGTDEYGWNPRSEARVEDVARKAAAPFAGRRFAVRVAPGLLGEGAVSDLLEDALADAPYRSWKELCPALLALDLPDAIREDLEALSRARRRAVHAYDDLYTAEDGGPRGVVFLAPLGLEGREEAEEGSPNATEDDTAGSLSGVRVTLARHSEGVEGKARAFAEAAGLPAARVSDVAIAGYLHDAGKIDPRFQAWLNRGDPLGSDPDDPSQVLAKSDRTLPRRTRATSGLPERWRHEGLSVRLAPTAARFEKEAVDPDLVLWLIGTHHGYGRPFFPHRDPDDLKTRRIPDTLGLRPELEPGPGPQSLAFDRDGLDWPALFERLKARYGVWELARMEVILRLADHHTSEDERRRAIPDGGSE